jgi:hypothetical protein
MINRMSEHRVICVVEERIDYPFKHVHLVGIGTGSGPEEIERGWSLDEFSRAVAGGDSFYTRGLVSSRMASVELTTCIDCGAATLTSGAGAVADNNLSSLRLCPYDSRQHLGPQ